MEQAGKMIQDYKSEREWKYIFFSLMLGYTAMIAWVFYDWGYNAAKIDYSQPIKYRCHEETVYRSTQGYWENTKQPCKPMNDIQ
jgi:hypothetical protein